MAGRIRLDRIPVKGNTALVPKLPMFANVFMSELPDEIMYAVERDIREAEVLGNKCSVCGGPNDIGEMCQGCADKLGNDPFDWPEKHHQDMKDNWRDD